MNWVINSIHIHLSADKVIRNHKGSSLCIGLFYHTEISFCGKILSVCQWFLKWRKILHFTHWETSNKHFPNNVSHQGYVAQTIMSGLDGQIPHHNSYTTGWPFLSSDHFYFIDASAFRTTIPVIYLDFIYEFSIHVVLIRGRTQSTEKCQQRTDPVRIEQTTVRYDEEQKYECSLHRQYDGFSSLGLSVVGLGLTTLLADSCDFVPATMREWRWEEQEFVSPAFPHLVVGDGTTPMNSLVVIQKGLQRARFAGHVDVLYLQ